LGVGFRRFFGIVSLLLVPKAITFKFIGEAQATPQPLVLENKPGQDALQSSKTQEPEEPQGTAVVALSTDHAKEITMNQNSFPSFVAKACNIALQSLIYLALLSAGVLCALAQDGHSHTAALQRPQTPEQQSQASALIKIVQDATERFKDVSVAEAEGYVLQFGCVSGPDSGAMGLHYINGAILSRGEIDPTHPPIVIYEPTANGGLKLIGADFLVFADAWDKKKQGPPEMMGQLFHYWESPNRFGLPAFYTLHVWAWKDNPNGAFVNWHPNVSCKQFNGQAR